MSKTSISNSRYLGVGSGVGLVIANMIGAGVFLSAGFMAQDLGPGSILVSWVIGAVIALSGAIAYAQLAHQSGRSGGEYRYLHDYLHPYIGCLAGWASLLIGFSAPIAVDAYAIGAFMRQLGYTVSLITIGSWVIIIMTLVHAIQLYWSKNMQNILVSLKFVFIIIFIVFGIALGNNAWPEWQPPNLTTSFPTKAFLENQYWVAFAFSGWNAAVYIAGEYSDPHRDVSRAIIIGCSLVALVYLAINWVFIANLSPELAFAVVDYDETRITLAHLVMVELVGSKEATIVSIIAILVFLSALSAMILVGARVYAEMANDGLLPKIFCCRVGKPPVGALIIQGMLALYLLHTQTILDIVKSAAAVIMIFSMLTVISLFIIRCKTDMENPTLLSLLAAIFYVISTIIILCAGILSSKAIVMVLTAILIAGTAGYIVAVKVPQSQ